MEIINSGHGWAIPVVPPAMTPETKSAVPPPMPVSNYGYPVMVSIDNQKWHAPCETDAGLIRGTLFPGLEKPFVGEGACRK